jgi:hypothetical protein
LKEGLVMSLKHVLLATAMIGASVLPTPVGATWNGTDQHQCAYTYNVDGNQSNGPGTRSAKSKQAAALAIAGDQARSRGIGNGIPKMVYGSSARMRPEAKSSAEKTCRAKGSDCVFMGCFRRK